MSCPAASSRPAHLPPKAEEESEHHRNLVIALVMSLTLAIAAAVLRACAFGAEWCLYSQVRALERNVGP